MSTFLLVHGAWHDGLCWKNVRARLESAGHVVVTLSLPLCRDATIADHVRIVVDLAHAAGERVILVGHSLGGVIVAGAMAAAPESIHHLVFLDAVIPQPGMSLARQLGGWLGTLNMAIIARSGLLPVLLSATELGVVNAEDAAWLDTQLRPHPVAIVRDPFPFAPSYDPIRTTYITCDLGIRFAATSPMRRVLRAILPPTMFLRFFHQAQQAGWQTAQLSCGHNVMLADEEGLVRHLLHFIQG